MSHGSIFSGQTWRYRCKNARGLNQQDISSIPTNGTVRAEIITEVSHTTGWCLSYVSQICLSLIIMNPEFWLKNRMPSSMMIPYQPAYPLVGQTWENSSIYFGHFAKEREDCADFSGFKGGKTSVFLKARRWVWERSNTCKHWHITCKEWGFNRHNMGICQMFVEKVITLTINIYQQWVPGAIYV